MRVVLIILATVAFGAVMFRPTSYYGQWRKLAQDFETERRPLTASFKNVAIRVGHGLRAMFTPWKRDLAEYGRFDVEIDDEGMWLLYDGPEPKKAPPSMLIPFARIQFVHQAGKWHYFEVYASQHIPLGMEHEVGAALMRRLEGDPSPPPPPTLEPPM